MPPDPLDTVRAMVEDVVRRGEILYWQDVAAWVTAERAKLGMEELQGRYPRNIIRALFTSIEESGTSRLVSHEPAQGDARERELFLLPNTLGDEHLVDLVLRARRSAPVQSPSNQLADKRAGL